MPFAQKLRRLALMAFAGQVLLASAALADILYLPVSNGAIEQFDTNDPANWVKSAPDETLTTTNITFNLTYMDNGTGVGFDDPANGAARRARLKDALTYVSDTLKKNGIIDVQVKNSLFDGHTVLASAGTLFSDSPGFTNGTSFQRLATGSKPFAGNPEIIAQVDFSFNWYLGTATPSGSQLDLLSVLTHECTHGMGFVSLMNSSGGSNIAPGVYTVWDSLLEKKNTLTPLLGGNPPAFVASVSDLTNNNVVFGGAHAFTLYGQPSRPPVVSSSPFRQGTSLVHWDDAIVGSVIMRPAFAPGEVQHAYAPVEVGTMQDLGYTDAGATYCDLTAVAITSPGATVTAAGGATSASVSLRSQVTDTGAAGCVPGTLQVTYKIDGAQVGQSQNSAGNFPINANVILGGHSLEADALVLETGDTATATSSFTVNAPAGPFLAVSPNPAGGVAFGSIQIGAHADQIFSVTNTGVGTLAGQLVLTGAGYTAITATTYSLGAGASTNITVRFAPAATGAVNGTARFNGGANGPIDIQLTGAGQNTALTVTPNPAGGVSFGTVQTGATSDHVFTVTNSGTAILTGTATASSAPFSIVGTATYTLAQNQSASITVRYSPTAEGTANGSVTFTGGGGNVVITLNGTAQTPPATGCGGGGGQTSRASDITLLIVGIVALTAASGRRSRKIE